MPHSRHIVWLILATWMAMSGAAVLAAAPDADLLTIEDYAKVRKITELSLSSDGEFIAYIVNAAEQSGNKAQKMLIVQEARAAAQAIDARIAKDARQITWIPGSHDLAYLSSSGGLPQIFKTNIDSGKTKQLTNCSQRILSYQFSPDGKALAWISQEDRAVQNTELSLYERLHDGDKGVVIDHASIRITHFVNPYFREGGAPPARSLWIERKGEKAHKAELSGPAIGFEWSPGGNWLSVSYLADPENADPKTSYYSSIGAYHIPTGRFSEIAAAVHSSKREDPVYYLGGEWAADERAIYVRRVQPSSIWRSYRDWARVTFNDGKAALSNAEWNEVKFYPASAQMNESENGTTHIEAVSNGLRSLYAVEGKKMAPALEIGGIEGDVYFVRRSSNQTVSAFVNESLIRAPEIFVIRNDETLQITEINSAVNDKRMPDAREVTWRSVDGVYVHGWLLSPPDHDQEQGPPPMVTFLHGGPNVPMTNSFAQYYSLYGGIWPYPLEILAARGVAVFIPNYRGTDSFGQVYANPERSDGEALGDVMLGIDSLVEAGLADPKRLGIAGHSHGAWLGAMTMTRMKNFVAASFGEGPQNNMLTYIFTPGYLYEEGYHKLWGGGLYDAPQRYIETSPVFHFEGLNTATLFEAGVQSQAISMMGSPKAAHLAGMPAEFVVYPKTGHNLDNPKLKKESAHRNLDWFLFWMLGVEDQSPLKQDQYERWRGLRAMRCESLSDHTRAPGYCSP